MNKQMTPTKANRAVVAGILLASEGTFIAADYVRKDGSSTSLNGRIGCFKGTKCGTVQGMPAMRYEQFTLYDVKRKGYRSISLDRIQRVTVRGRTYTIAD